MNLRRYLGSWTSAIEEVKTQRIANVALSFLCVVLVFALLTKHTVVIEQPPRLTKEAWISNNQADDEILVQWGMAYAELFGNVTPTTAPYLKNALAPMLTPRIYHELLDAVDVQAKQLREEQVTVQFTPTAAKKDPRTGHVIVTGELTTTGVQGTATHELRTYDISLVVLNYRILIDEVDVYKGEPRVAATH